MAFTSVVIYVCERLAVSKIQENGNLKRAQFKMSRSTGWE